MEYTPAELLSKYQSIRAPMTGEQFFRRRGLQRVREMWCASRFAAGVDHHIAPCKVLMDDVDDQRSGDFAIRFEGGRTQTFELAEVQREGRRRGDEYRERGPGSQWLEALMDPQEAMRLIHGAIEAKAQKFYSDQARLQLLVYVNLGARDLDPAEVQKYCEPVTAGFAGVWLLTGEQFACIHQTPEQIQSPEWMVLPPVQLADEVPPADAEPPR